MIRPRSVSLTSILAILFVSFAIPAFANRGGGGGGFHGGGGGGFHSGGGSRSGAGGFQGGSFRGGSSAPRMSAGFSRPAQSAPMRSGGGSFARPGGGNVNRSYANSAAGSQRMGNSSSAPAAMADGQWHSFGNPAGGRAGAADAPQSQASSGTGGGFHVFAGNRSAAGVQSTRSFSGQGNQVWENASIPRNAVSSSRALSNIRGSFGNSPAGATGLRSGSALLPNSRIAGSSVLGSRAISGGLGSNRAATFGNRLPFGNTGFGFRGGNRWGCWNCGFGRGFGFGLWPGWGFGWPWFGYSYWDPFFWDLSWGWPGYGYGYYGYPAGYPYGYDGSDYNSYNDSSSYVAPSDNYESEDSTSSAPPAAPAEQSPTQTYSVANGAVPVLIYLKNGSVLSARDYWFSGDQIHYVLTNGREGVFDADQLDLQRTIDENAKSGVKFVVKSDANGIVLAPNNPAPSLDQTGLAETSGSS